MEQVEFTNNIPLCPFCRKPTKRTGGMTVITAAYYQPMYDENGINTNPDRNTHTSNYECLDCGKQYEIAGNETDGYHYTHIKRN